MLSIIISISLYVVFSLMKYQATDDSACAHSDDSIFEIRKELHSIQSQVEKISSNQTFLRDGFNLWAMLSLLVAIMTVIGIDQMRSKNVDKATQYKLFIDMVRHLYRNKICTDTMLGKYLALKDSYPNCYPSEEHYMKLKLLPSDIHFEEYYKDSEKFHKMHEMELLLRNYNIEIDVALAHISNPDVSFDVKLHDFKTLDFKTGFLTKKILDLLNYLNPQKNNLQMIQKTIIASHEENEKGNPVSFHDSTILVHLDTERLREDLNDMYFSEIFEDDKKMFKSMLNIDLAIEAGKNRKGENKINIIGI